MFKVTGVLIVIVVLCTVMKTCAAKVDKETGELQAFSCENTWRQKWPAPQYIGGPYPISTGILPHSLPEWAFRATPGLWRICLCPKVARIAEQKFGSR